MGDFSHLSQDGSARMVDIGGKVATTRVAIARGWVRVSGDCMQSLDSNSLRELTTTARLAGIQASKLTSHLIPLCHQIPLSKVDLELTVDREECKFCLTVTTATTGSTGVEMEALTAASVAGLTIYDMIKACDPAASVGPFELISKSGGKHGSWSRPNE